MPKMTAFRRWPYRARVFNHREIPVPGTVPPTTATEYFFLSDIRLDIAQSMFGSVTVILPDTAITVMQGARLTDLTDLDGNPIYPGGIWSLASIMPIFYLGKREGFRANAKLIGASEPDLSSFIPDA